ncbi:MAG: ABC transporter ATP-binding protein [Deltaproteobacteria bacterium]
MIQVTNLCKKFGNVTAVNNLNFSVEKGEILGFLGPNGAGKTTTMNIITGYMPPSEGTVKINDMDILEDSSEVRKIIGYAPEIPPLYTEMTVEEYLCFAADLKKIPKGKRSGSIDKVMELTKIADVRKRLINNLSKGYKQRVGIAQALLGDPEVLILDEPTAGLDPKQIIEIRNLIKELGKNHTIILSSHILPEINAVCERVVIINKGEIVAIDSPEKLSSNLSGTAKIEAQIEGPLEEVIKAILEIEGVKNVTSTEEQEALVYIIETESSVDIRKILFFKMAENKYPILQMKKQGLTLEQVFLQLTTTEKEEVE